jgi:intein-encoded DNA endonuclease-like protein
VRWLNLLKDLLAATGQRSWIYKEGRDRSLYVLETTAKFLNLRFDPDELKSKRDKIAYVQGYFDAEGGIPRNSQDRFYVQSCQKNRTSLEKVKSVLEEIGIGCGKIHNPSAKIDPQYWRFFVKANSRNEFMRKINSQHPRKQKMLRERMKI